MPRTQEARTWLSFRQIVTNRVGTRAAVLAITGTGMELWPVEQGGALDQDLQHRLWSSPGKFFATGHVEADRGWKVERWPATEEAKAIERVLGLPVYAAFERQEVGNPFAGLRPEFEFG